LSIGSRDAYGTTPAVYPDRRALAISGSGAGPSIPRRRRRGHGYSVIRQLSLYCARPFIAFLQEIQRAAVSNTESSDTHFFNSFSLVLGILIAVAIILFAVARQIGANTQGREILSDPLHVQDVETNISPIAREAIAGKDNSALAVPVAAPTAADVPTTGEQAFTKVCSACHALGINGAPKIGDHAAWGPRIAQGKETLYQHAIAGKGNMPPRGGTTWPDATIRMAVDYMVSLNK
jgi:cytochrome c5